MLLEMASQSSIHSHNTFLKNLNFMGTRSGFSIQRRQVTYHEANLHYYSFIVESQKFL